MEARAKKEMAQRRLILISILCVVLPPVGMILVWRGRYQNKGKIAFTAVATLCMTLIFCLILSLQPPQEIEVSAFSASSYAVTTTDENGNVNVTYTAPPVVPVENEIIAPANPNG